MKKVLLFFGLFSAGITYAQNCTTTNGTGCACKDGSTDCDLLPDITMADEPLTVTGNNGVIEYAQTGAGVNSGRLRVSISTPNIGHGPLTVRSSNNFICGSDTFTTNPGTCPDGSAPRQLVFQRVYHKNGNGMSYWDRPAGSMTYHPTHNHMHVDDWGVYTLRQRDSLEPNPLNWPLIGSGAKLGFCLMDYGTCSYYNGHCEDSARNVMMNGDFPNFGLGGGSYNCNPAEQGITSGYTDIYYQYLDGMWVNLPAGLCNGTYWIVVHIDPHNYFLEEKEDNNVIAMPWTLTQQTPAGSGLASITSNGGLDLCEGSSITLTASPGNNYLWSNGESTQSITVTDGGNYSVQVSSACGNATSPVVQVNKVFSHLTQLPADSTICAGGSAVLTAAGTGTLHWFDAANGGSSLTSGNTFSTPSTTNSATYYVESRDTVWGASGQVGPVDNSLGAGGMFSGDQHQILAASKAVIIRSAKVYAGSSGNRTFELRSNTGAVIASKQVNLVQGEQRVSLNFSVPTGSGYQLGWTAGSNPNIYRNSAGAVYPYTLNNLLSITGTSATNQAYYYGFYDLEVEQAPISCASTRTPVNVNVEAAPALTLSGLPSLMYNDEAAVTLSGTPAGGTFSGPGVSGSTFDPSIAGAGGPYDIVYNFESALGCTYSVSKSVTVNENTNIGLVQLDNGLSLRVFPNPVASVLNLEFTALNSSKMNIRLMDASGRVVRSLDRELSGKVLESVSVSDLAAGTYQLQLSSGSSSRSISISKK